MEWLKMPLIAVANYQHTDKYPLQLLLSPSQFAPAKLRHMQYMIFIKYPC